MEYLEVIEPGTLACHDEEEEEVLVTRVPFLAAVLMVAGGAVLLSTLTIDYMPAAGFWTYIFVQGLGFLLVLSASLLSRPVVEQSWGWAAFVLGSAAWLVCWSWFLHLGLVLPIPLVFWATVATAAYLASSAIFMVNSEPMAAGVAGVVAAGSALSTYVMASHPIFASDYNYVPFSVGAVIGGLICAFAVVKNPPRAHTGARIQDVR